MRVVPRQAGAPARRVADVAAGMGEERRAVQPVPIAMRAWEAIAVAGLGTDLEEGVGGREPLHLQAILCELAAEERLIHEWLVDEVPRVRVDLVEIAEPREEPSALDRESVAQRDG